MDFLGEDYYIRRPILPLSDVLENHRDKVLIVGIWEQNNCDEVVEWFIKSGFPTVTDLSGYLFSKACNGMISHQKELYYLEKAWDYFTDESDREIILNKALLYVGAKKTIPVEKPQYFTPFMEVNDNEIFVDGGFYIGDTAESFIEVTGGRFKKYYAFEPNTNNLDKVSQTIKNDSRIVITQAGVYSHCTKLLFNDQEADSSSFEQKKNCNTKVPVVSLDAFFADKEKPTFIKMDIEGSEALALLGAKKLIAEYKPKLAICVYHKPEDIIEIPKLIKEIVPEYKFKLGHHLMKQNETVLYCKV
jgi:FkbM family methyltransferase